MWSVYSGITAMPFESVWFQAFAPLAAFPRYASVRALGVADRPLSGYCAGVPLGLSVDQIVAPLTGNPVESTLVARSQRRRNTFPAGAGRSAGCHADMRAGSCVRSLVTSYWYPAAVPSPRRSL